MGFLDRMLTQAIRRETGLNVGRLVRRIGARRLLMLGGAAVAGGLLTQSQQQQSARTKSLGGGAGTRPAGGGGSAVSSRSIEPSRRSTAPPEGRDLPPPPAKAPLPPLPPLETDADLPEVEEIPEVEDQALLRVAARILVAAAVADGTLQDAEREMIEQTLEEGALNQESQDRVRRDLLRPASPEDLAAEAPEGTDPRLLLDVAVGVTRADGELNGDERRWLVRLATALGAPAETIDEIEEELFGSGS